MSEIQYPNGEWLRHGNLLYTLEECRDYRGRLQQQNRLMVRIERQNDVPDQEFETLAVQLHNFLRSSSSSSGVGGAQYKVGDKFHSQPHPNIISTITAISDLMVDWDNTNGTQACANREEFDSYINSGKWIILPAGAPASTVGGAAEKTVRGRHIGVYKIDWASLQAAEDAAQQAFVELKQDATNPEALAKLEKATAYRDTCAGHALGRILHNQSVSASPSLLLQGSAGGWVLCDGKADHQGEEDFLHVLMPDRTIEVASFKEASWEDEELWEEATYTLPSREGEKYKTPRFVWAQYCDGNWETMDPQPTHFHPKPTPPQPTQQEGRKEGEGEA